MRQEVAFEAAQELGFVSGGMTGERSGSVAARWRLAQLRVTDSGPSSGREERVK